MTDEELMRRALALAERGRYGVSPNPMVGALIVRDGQVVSEGFHARAGEPHAEVLALRGCPDARGATMVVTLEPCAHFGRTPPCVDAITDAGVARVVMAMRDPHARAAGGAERLRAHGIEVVTGVLEDEARRLNEKFLHGITRRRPFVLLKAGMTFDGKLATVDGDSKWITSPAAREASLKLREEYDAIAVGGGTVLADDPQLTRRLGLNTSVQPWLRVLLDRDRVVPLTARVLSDGNPTLHIANDVDLDELLAALYEKGVSSLIVEGGSVLLSEFLRRQLWQKMIVFLAPAIVGGAAAPAFYGGEPVRRLADAFRFRFEAAEMVGPDVMLTGYPLIADR
jgi:diaminohydroxyphosphoribosylaminopyrimidine deaminase/5-amino-6-(5-phosphoribosylamino)uracil reductase